MHADSLYLWHQAIGDRLARTVSRDWQSDGFGVYQAIPNFDLEVPAEDELQFLFKEKHAVAVRYCVPPRTCASGADSYHVICDQENYTLENLSMWARKNVRRGLRNCAISPVPLAYIADNGYRLVMDTRQRQGRKLTITAGQWRSRFLAAVQFPAFEGWAAKCNDELAAFLITVVIGDTCIMLLQQCSTAHLREHANNALGFYVTSNMRSRPGIRQVMYGMRPLDAPPSVDEFKFRIGYRAKPVTEVVRLHPALGFLAGRLAGSVVRLSSRLAPSFPAPAKAAGLLRLAAETRHARRAPDTVPGAGEYPR